LNTFHCTCGNKLFFENSQCQSCGRKLGFLPDINVISALEPVNDHIYKALANDRHYHACKNYFQYEVCNWMVEENDSNEYCQSCRLNEIIPNLSEPDNLVLWYRIEKAKRRLLYTLKSLRLPIIGRDIDAASGLAFRFMEDKQFSSEFHDQFAPNEAIMTGHTTGTITINLAEADPSEREEIRIRMNERYRTLLGHFRHESGHYYWDKLVRDTHWLEKYRELFGDERMDYKAALESYYRDGPPADWEQCWISAYASAHPWEDFAETWAHYLHMIDTLDTAHDYGFSVHGRKPATVKSDVQFNTGYFTRLSDLLDDWKQLTSALNAMNRSMGLPDAYPFYPSDLVRAKLEMIHEIVIDSSN